MKVVRAGTYGHGRRTRQLWWCHPDDGTPAHRFAEQLPRTLLSSAEPHACTTCETQLANHEGPQHPRQYEFAARVIAQALVAVGSGVTYVHAAKTARVTAGVAKRWVNRKPRPPRVRKPGSPSRRRHGGANGTLVGDWVGSFGPVVTGPVFDAETWPDIVALDEFWFNKVEKRWGRKPTKELIWGVFGAYAHPESQRRGYLFRLGVTSAIDSDAGVEWLRSIPGRPTDIVCDGTGIWRKAAPIAWPQVIDYATGVILEDTPRIWPCRQHISNQLVSLLRAESVLPPRGTPAAYRPETETGRKRTGMNKLLRAQAEEPDWYKVHKVALRDYVDDKHPLVIAVNDALRSVEDWDYCLTLARKWQTNQLATWMSSRTDIREDLQTRPRHIPNSIGGLEGVQRRAKMNLVDRARVLRNTVRTQRLLDLMTLHLRNRDVADLYATRIRAHLEAHAGQAPAQRIGVTGGPHLHHLTP